MPSTYPVARFQAIHPVVLTASCPVTPAKAITGPPLAAVPAKGMTAAPRLSGMFGADPLRDTKDPSKQSPWQSRNLP